MLRQVYHSGGDGTAVCEVRGDSETVYLVRGSGLSRPFVKPNKPEKPDRRDEPERPDEPAPRHAPRNVGLQNLTIILHTPFFMTSGSFWIMRWFNAFRHTKSIAVSCLAMSDVDVE